jgi:hypothetical protein
MNLASGLQRDREALERADKAGIDLWLKEFRVFLDGLKQQLIERWM